MSKIRILHIIKSLGRGGAEMLLPETLKIHDNSSFEFHYIYFLPWKDQMVDAIELAGGKVTCFPASNNLQLLFQFSKVVQYCKKNNIDIIHSHLPWSGFLSRIVHYKSNIPAIYTEHNIQERYHVATRILNRFSFNVQTHALGVSEDVTRSINENIKPDIPVQTVLNGVNTSYFHANKEKRGSLRTKLGIPSDAVVIGNIAVFREQKNILGWIKAFKQIRDGNPAVYGLLVGSGPQEEEILKLIEQYQLKERIILPGLQTDTLSYFSAMDIFMMSSDFEGLPIALLEAMSMSCAVVSSKAGGVVEVIRDEKDGLLCEVGDWSCLAAKTVSLIENHSKRAELQWAARERVVHSFSLTSMVDQLESLYGSVVNVTKRVSSE